MVKVLRRKWAEAVEYFGEARQFMAKGAKWLSRNDGDRLEETREGVLEVRECLVVPEPERRANGKPTKAAEAMNCGAANAAAKAC